MQQFEDLRTSLVLKPRGEFFYSMAQCNWVLNYPFLRWRLGAKHLLVAAPWWFSMTYFNMNNKHLKVFIYLRHL